MACSCVEKKISIPRVAHTTVTMYVRRSHFLHFRMLLFFSVTSYPAEIAHFNSPNRELSNFVQLMELYWSKIVDPSRNACLKIVNGKRFQRRNFLVLRPLLLKNAYPEYPREYNWWSCGKEKLLIPLEAHDKAQSSDIFLSFQAKKLKEL